MRAIPVVVRIAFVFLAPSLGAAQASPPFFRDLALQVNLGDRLRLVEHSGVRVAGRLTGLTRQQIVIRTEAGEQRVAGDMVREVAVRGYTMRRSALIGAGVFAVLGTALTCTREGGNDCVIIGSLGAAPIGAGVGLAMGALIPRMRTVYRADAVDVRSPAAVGVQASLLEDLALRVNLDDQLVVEDQSGVSATGRLTRLTDDEFTIRTSKGDERFMRQGVRQVAVRRQPLRMAVLIGAGLGAATGAVAACTGPDREECADAPIIAGALGAGLGLAVGALIHRATIVFPEPVKLVRISPVIHGRSFGVQASARW